MKSYTFIFSLFGFFLSLLVAFLIRYPMTLTSATSWGFQNNPSFNFWVLRSGLSRAAFRDTPDICFFSWQIPQSFLLSSKSESCVQNCQGVLFVGIVTWPPCSIISPAFILYCLSWLSWKWIFRPRLPQNQNSPASASMVLWLKALA